MIDTAPVYFLRLPGLDATGPIIIVPEFFLLHPGRTKCPPPPVPYIGLPWACLYRLIFSAEFGLNCSGGSSNWCKWEFCHSRMIHQFQPQTNRTYLLTHLRQPQYSQILFFLRCLPVFLATPVFWILQNLSLTLSYEYTLSEIPSLASSVSLSFSPRIPPFYPLLQYNPELSALGFSENTAAMIPQPIFWTIYMILRKKVKCNLLNTKLTEYFSWFIVS